MHISGGFAAHAQKHARLTSSFRMHCNPLQNHSNTITLMALVLTRSAINACSCFHYIANVPHWHFLNAERCQTHDTSEERHTACHQETTGPLVMLNMLNAYRSKHDNVAKDNGSQQDLLTCFEQHSRRELEQTADA